VSKTALSTHGGPFQMLSVSKTALSTHGGRAFLMMPAQKNNPALKGRAICGLLKN